MPFPAFLDTCVLYPAYLCDTLLRLAEASAYRPLWSADVLAELRRNLIDRGIPAERVDRRVGRPRVARTGRSTKVRGGGAATSLAPYRSGSQNHPPHLAKIITVRRGMAESLSSACPRVR